MRTTALIVFLVILILCGAPWAILNLFLLVIIAGCAVGVGAVLALMVLPSRQ